MQLKPLGTRIVVEPIPVEEVRKSGLIIPGAADEKPMEGTVLAVGEGSMHDGKHVALDVKVGDRILFGKHIGTEVMNGSKKLLVMHEHDILSIIVE